MIEFEELALENEELELIEKRCLKVNVPLVYVPKNPYNLYFNVASSAIIPEFIKWYTTTNLVIGLPSSEKDKDHYPTFRNLMKNGGGITTRFPSVLIHQKKVKPGYYKIYKYKDGFAFKRYEQFGLEGNDE